MTLGRAFQLAVLIGFIPMLAFGCPVRDRPVTVNGVSMAPLLQNGQEMHLLEGFYACHPLQRGDVVAFAMPGRKNLVIKRVMALPGDRFDYEGQRLRVNGAALTNSGGEAYQFASRMLALYAHDYPALPPSLCLVLGDHAEGGGLDSSRFGFLEQGQIAGKVAPVEIKYQSQ